MENMGPVLMVLLVGTAKRDSGGISIRAYSGGEMRVGRVALLAENSYNTCMEPWGWGLLMRMSMERSDLLTIITECFRFR